MSATTERYILTEERARPEVELTNDVVVARLDVVFLEDFEHVVCAHQLVGDDNDGECDDGLHAAHC